MADFRDGLRRVRLNVNGRPADLIGASFRGVAFCIETVELATGRRVVVHEFPLRDDPFVEDLGRRARKFKVDAYVLGDDYVAQRNTLLDALEAEGPGALVLPSYDTKRAIGDVTNVRETRADGGYAVITIEFVETPAQSPTPAIVDDAPGKVASSADAAHVATQAQFKADYDPAGLPAFALASAETAVTKASAALSSTLAPLVSDAQELANFNAQLAIITAQASTLVRQPEDLVSQFLGAITGLTTTAAAAPGAVKDALVDAYHEDLGALADALTATRARELANQLALQGALRRTMATEAARLAPFVPYASIEEATASRDEIAALLDEQAEGAGDTAYPGLVDLRAQVMRAVPGTTVFPRVITVTRRVAVPSLLLAYQLYGKVDQEQDVIARNRVRHPGFIVGELRVLSAG